MVIGAFRVMLAVLATLGLMSWPVMGEPRWQAAEAGESAACRRLGASLDLSDSSSVQPHSSQVTTPEYDEAQCTWWAWFRADQTGWELPPQGMGNGGSWDEYARARNWPVGRVAMGGSIAVWDPGCAGADEDAGHVAFVESVKTDGQIYISEYNWECDYCYGDRTIEVPTCMEFIYRPYPTLFEHVDYAGAWLQVTSSIGDFAGQTYSLPEGNGIGLNDSVSSIWIPFPWSAFLYRNSVAQGRCGSIGFECAHNNLHSLVFSDLTAAGDNASSIWIGELVCLYDFQCNGSYASCTAPPSASARYGDTGTRGVCSGSSTPCPAPTLLSPGNGHTETDDNTLTFFWDNVSCDHDGFTFRIKTVSDMESEGQIVIDTGVGGTARTETLSAQWENDTLYWSVRAANAPGGASWAPSRMFRISPNAVPNIAFDAANNDSFPSGRIEGRDRNWTFQGTASDSDGQINRVEFRCGSPCDNTGSGPGQTGGGNWSMTRSDMLGRNDIYFVAYDNQGASASSRHLDLNIDLAAPSTGHNLAGTIGKEGWYVTPVEVHLHANEVCTMNACAGVQEIRYRIDGGNWQVQAGDDKWFTVGYDGGHTVEYYAVDEVGNVEGTRQVTFKIDATPPTAPGAATETHGIQSGQWQRNVNDPAFAWLPAIDGQSGLSYYRVNWNGSLQVVTSPAYDPPVVTTGSHVLSVQAVDRAGNLGPVGAAFTFHYDGTPPHAPTIQNNDGVASGVWQNQVRTANFSWPTPHDEGSGIAGYNVYWGTDP